MGSSKYLLCFRPLSVLFHVLSLWKKIYVLCISGKTCRLWNLFLHVVLSDKHDVIDGHIGDFSFLFYLLVV